MVSLSGYTVGRIALPDVARGDERPAERGIADAVDGVEAACIDAPFLRKEIATERWVRPSRLHRPFGVAALRSEGQRRIA